MLQMVPPKFNGSLYIIIDNYVLTNLIILKRWAFPEKLYFTGNERNQCIQNNQHVKHINRTNQWKEGQNPWQCLPMS